MRGLPYLLLGVTLAVLVPACATGPRPVKVSGNLTFNQQPLKIDPKGSVTVRFNGIVEEGPNASAFAASVREDMTFDVPGPAGQGIPPGKYRISILIMVPETTAEINEINARFTQQGSQIVREVSGDASIVLDLAKADGK